MLILWNICKTNSKYRPATDMLYVNNGFKVYETSSGDLVYSESKYSFTSNHILYNNIEDYYYINNSGNVISEVFSGVQIGMKYNSPTSSFSEEKSGWVEGNADVNIIPPV